jgi:hypothetical protein
MIKVRKNTDEKNWGDQDPPFGQARVKRYTKNIKNHFHGTPT